MSTIMHVLLKIRLSAAKWSELTLTITTMKSSQIYKTNNARNFMYTVYPSFLTGGPLKLPKFNKVDNKHKHSFNH